MLCGAIINFTFSEDLLMYSTNKFSSFGQELPITIVVLLFLNSSIKSKELSLSKIETTRSKRVSPETFTLLNQILCNNFLEL